MVEVGQSGDLAVKALSFGEGSGCFSRALVCSSACWLLVGREGEETGSRGKVFKGRKEGGGLRRALWRPGFTRVSAVGHGIVVRRGRMLASAERGGLAGCGET